jgi:TPR repeat protein
MKHIHSVVIAVSLLVGSVSTVTAQDYQKASEAYEAGDYQTALQEWRLLAEQGDKNSQFWLGIMYRNGQGVPQDYSEAVKWYRLAAEQGDNLGQTNLGFMYRTGKGVPQNLAEAIKWYRLSAEQGYAAAQNNLAAMYTLGQGVLQSNVMAHMWFNVAAANGLEKAGERRDERSGLMTNADISKAQEMARECMNSDYQNCGN